MLLLLLLLLPNIIKPYSKNLLRDFRQKNLVTFLIVDVTYVTKTYLTPKRVTKGNSSCYQK